MGNKGRTPLHFAVSRGKPLRLIKLLVESGADPAIIRGSGRTPLDVARLRCGRGFADIVAYLEPITLPRAQPQDPAEKPGCLNRVRNRIAHWSETFDVPCSRHRSRR